MDDRIPAFDKLFSFRPKAYVTNSRGYRYKQTARAKMMKDARRVAETMPDYDRAAYSRGWQAANRGTSIEAGADKPAAWDDGFSDAAAGREKWHTPLCPNHGPATSGGCGR